MLADDNTALQVIIKEEQRRQVLIVDTEAVIHAA